MIHPASGRFRPGDAVRVLNEDRSGHIRTPYYIRGKTGCRGGRSISLRSSKPMSGDRRKRRGINCSSTFTIIGWNPRQATEDIKMSTSGDEHGHEHPRHELSPQAKRIYAIRDLLLEKGVITKEDIQSQIEYQEARSPANGAKIV